VKQGIKNMKSNVFILLTLLVSAALMLILQQRSIETRLAERTKDRGALYMNRHKLLPTAGFDAAVADFMWMRTNLRRQPKMKEGLSAEEKKDFQKREAELLLRGYNTVVSLDPTFKKAYNFAILRIMSDLPEKAIALAEMAMTYCPQDRKEFAEIAGHIASTVRKDNKQAFGFYGICVEGGPTKDYIGRRYLRTGLRIEGIDPYLNDLPVLAQRIFYYNKVRTELNAKSEQGSGMEGEGSMGMDSGMGENWIQPIVLQNVRDFMLRAVVEKPAADLVTKIKAIYDSMKPAGHACSRCYSFYEAGDKFCSSCGFTLEVFGVCAKDGTILKGDFCHECGLAKVKAQ
jgi:hypothetical protein